MWFGVELRIGIPSNSKFDGGSGMVACIEPTTMKMNSESLIAANQVCVKRML
jgi:hypothetical protein